MLIPGHLQALIERQHGHVARRQLRAAGIPRRTIGNWAARGDLIAVHAGVYAVRYRRAEPIARAMAAVLACGPDAVLSHGSALALWRLSPFPSLLEVFAPSAHRRAGIRARRTTTLTSDDTTTRHNIPTVTAARAIADTHRRFTDRQLTRMVQDARRRGILGRTALHTLLDRCRRLQQLVDPAQNPTRSSLEDLLLPWLRRHGLPLPIIGHLVNGYEVDAYFPEHNLILEVDGWPYHNGRGAFLTDRERDAHHLAHGTPTVRVTDDRFDGYEAQRLRAILGRRRP